MKQTQDNNTQILVVGDVMLDRYWLGDVDRISPEAPVPVVRVTQETFRLGGAANVAANCRSLGNPTSLLSATGDDEAARHLIQLLEQADIHALLTSDERLTTTVKLRVTGRQQQLLRIDFETEPSVDALERLCAVFEEQLDQAGIVIFSDYGKGGLNLIERKIAAAQAAGIPTLIDPKGANYAPYRNATLVTPNRAELAHVVGSWSSEAELEEKAQRLRKDLNIKALLVTRSEEGMSLFDSQGQLRVPAEAREVFDVTGAGDTVIATIAVLLARGMPLRETIAHANRAAGLVVGKFGTASVTTEELFA